MKFIIELLLGRFAQKLDGHKTNIGGIGLVFLGLSGVIGWMWPDIGLPPMELEAAFGYIAAGFGVLGIGGKLEKVRKGDCDEQESSAGRH